MDLHQAVDLLMINDVTFFHELISDILVTVAAKLMLESEGWNAEAEFHG